MAALPATPGPLLARIDAELAQAPLPISMRAPGGAEGSYRSRHTGPGIELAGMRAYQPGDDVRRIDWAATARSTNAQLRLSELERTANCWVVVDTSASMRFGTDAATKADVAAELAWAFAMVAARHRLRVGLVISDGRAPFVTRPVASRSKIISMLAAVVGVPGGIVREAVARPTAASTFDTLTESAVHAARTPSVVVVISDFLDLWPARPRSSEAGRAWRALCARHDVTACRVLDRRERELTGVGVIKVRDSETGRQRWVDTSSQRLRDDFAHAAKDRDDAIAGAVRPVELVTFDTSGTHLRSLAAHLHARGRVLAGASR